MVVSHLERLPRYVKVRSMHARPFTTEGKQPFWARALQACVGAQVNLALTCKAMLPVLGMGRVVVRLSPPNSARPLLHVTRCMVRDPGAVTHLELTTRWRSLQKMRFYGTRQLIDLGCAQAPCPPWRWRMHGSAPALAAMTNQEEPDVVAAAQDAVKPAQAHAG